MCDCASPVLDSLRKLREPALSFIAEQAEAIASEDEPGQAEAASELYRMAIAVLSERYQAGLIRELTSQHRLQQAQAADLLDNLLSP